MNLRNTLLLCLSLFFVFGCSNNQSYFEKAVTHQNDADYTKAIELYNLSIKKGEKVAESEKALGDISFGDKNYDEAFEHYKKSIESNPNVALETVMKYISYNDIHVREILGNMLANIQNEQAVKQINENLSQILKSDEQYKILDALFVISKMNEKNITPLTNDIIALLDKNNIIKQKTLEILPNIKNVVPDSVGIVDKLTSFLSQEDEIIKAAAIDCLGNMHEYAIKALPDLINIASNEEIFKEKAISAISKLGLPTKEQMEQMTLLLKDKTKEIKIQILNNTETFSEKARDYVPYIILFLDDQDNDVQQAARSALAKIGKASSESVPELIKLLKENNDEVVSRAIYELDDLGKASLPAIEALKEIAQTTDNKDIKKLANNAIQKIQQ